MKKVIKKTIFSTVILLLICILFTCFVRTKPVNIVYMSDSHYVPYVIVSLHSAIKNKKETSLYNVYIMAKDFTNSDIQKIKKLEQSDVHISIVPTAEHELLTENLGRFSSFKIALQKIFIANYLKELNKAIYLDADTLVEKDLTELFNIDLKDNYVGAVKDGLMYQFPQHIEELELKDKKFYFNSGVMLLNLSKIRTDNIVRRAVIYFNTHNEVYGDQDVLNVVFSGKVVPLSYRYNCNSTFFEEKSAIFLSKFWEEAVPQTTREVYDNAVILHFAGHKPWTQWFEHSYLKPLWYEYASEAKSKYHMID